MARMLDRSELSYLHPDWTTEEVSQLVGHWRSLESTAKARCKNPKDTQGSLDKYLAKHLSRQSNKARSHRAIQTKRAHMYEVVRFAGTFNEMQTFSGDRVWFDLTKKEQHEVKMPTRVRKTLSTLTRESYNMLIKMKSVRKWTKVRKAIPSKPNAPVIKDKRHSPKGCSCWSAAEVKQLVSTWSLVMSTTNTSIRAFVEQDCIESARLYAPWNRSTLSSWRKMKRIAASYLFIRAFDAQQSLTRWYQLSDGAQNLQMDWDNLPPDFEDIDRDVFEKIQRLDFSLGSLSSPPRVVSAMDNKPPVSESASSIEDRDRDIQASFSCRSPSHEVPKKSLHLRYPSPPIVQNGAKKTQDVHGECMASYNHVEQLQKTQLKHAIQCLKADLERDTELSADTMRAIFFERLGDPGQNGDATFVANLLEEQQRQVRLRFDQFQREHCSTVVHHDFVFGPR